MTQARHKTLAPVLAGTAIAIGLSLIAAPKSADAVPMVAAKPGAHASAVEPVGRIYRRGRPPAYPYYYTPGRRGGWSFYFGFVPYAKGDYEIQALQRRYPEANWPPSMRYPFPRP